jgi:hypothetical protein
MIPRKNPTVALNHYNRLVSTYIFPKTKTMMKRKTWKVFYHQHSSIHKTPARVPTKPTITKALQKLENKNNYYLPLEYNSPTIDNTHTNHHH